MLKIYLITILFQWCYQQMSNNDDTGITIGSGSGTIHESTEINTTPHRTSGCIKNIHSLFGVTAGQLRRDVGVYRSAGSILPYLSQTVQEESGSIYDRLFSRGQQSYGRYISDVFQCGTEGAARTLCRNFSQILREQQPRGLFIICKHGTHVHTAHDCSYSNQQCRCRIFEKAQAGLIRTRRPFRRAPRIVELQISDYRNIIFYFSNKGREIYEIRIAGQMEKIPDRDEDLGERESEGSGTSEQMETCFDVDGPELRRKISYEYLNARPTKAHRAISEGKPKKGQKILKLIFDFCLNNPCSPINAVCTHEKWLTNSDLMFLSLDDRCVKNAINAFSNRLCSWTFQDYNVMYKRKECNPVFVATIGNYNDYYYNIEDSKAVLIKLLEFQFNNDQDKILQFMTDLYNVLERKIPKRNGILLHAPPDRDWETLYKSDINCKNLS